MKTFKETQNQAKKEGYIIDMSDYQFALYLIQGYPYEEVVLLSGKYKFQENQKKAKSEAAIKQNKYNMIVRSKKVAEDPKIKWLCIYLTPFLLDDIKEYVTANLDKFDFISRGAKQSLIDDSIVTKLARENGTATEELTETEIKNFMTNIIRLKHTNIMGLDVKEITVVLQMVKMYLDRYVAKQEDNPVERHIIEMPIKYNAFCTTCNKEIYIERGWICKCQHCQTINDATE